MAVLDTVALVFHILLEGLLVHGERLHRVLGQSIDQYPKQHSHQY
jgi:hypothetical protein